jgi:hypothetical protein
MKGIQGLIIAIGLGIVGALFNFAYLYNKSQETENEEFIGIAPSVTVNRGEVLREEHLTAVPIPRALAGKLKDFAFLWSGRRAEIDQRVARTLTGGSLLLRSDMETPRLALGFSQNLKPGIEETALGVPVDSRRGVASLIEPGDMVTFIVPGTASESPTPASSDDEPTPADAAGPAAPGKTEPGKPEPAKPEPGKTSPLKPVPAGNARRSSPGSLAYLGPFKVLSIGNRLGSTEVMRANRIPQTQENVLNVLVHLERDKDNKWKLEPEAERLERILEENNNRPLTFLPHPRAQKSE